MAESRKVVNLLGAAGVALFALTGGALADGYEGSIKDAPAARRPQVHVFLQHRRAPRTTSSAASRRPTTIRRSRAPSTSATASSTPASGLRASTSERVRSTTRDRGRLVRRHQADLGPATFDFGVIYYTYPGVNDSGSLELDYVELKAGVSGEVFDKPDGRRRPCTTRPSTRTRRRDCGRRRHTGLRSAAVPCLHSDGHRGLFGLRLDDRGLRPLRATTTRTGMPAWHSRSRSSPSTSATGTRTLSSEADASGIRPR